MRIRLMLIAAAAILALPGHGRAQATRADPALDSLMVLERRLWDAWKARDLATIRALSAPDYHYVDESGPPGSGMEGIVEMYDQARLIDFRLDPMDARWIAPNVVMITYNAYMNATLDGRDVSRSVAEASLWVKRDARWLNVFVHEITRQPPQPH